MPLVIVFFIGKNNADRLRDDLPAYFRGKGKTLNSKYKKSKRKPMPEHVKEAWDCYFVTKDADAKNVLLAYYQFLVKNIMRPYWVKKPAILDMDDLHSAGNLGLMQAIERYKDGSDASFETFAQLRVHGSILDEINSLDWTPRNVRKNIREVLEAENRIASSGRKVTIQNVAEYTGLTEEEVMFAKSSSHRTFILPVDQDSMREMENSGGTSHGSLGISTSFDGNQRGSSGLEFRLSIMGELNIDEQRVIYLRFFCGETIIRIGEILNLPTSKVSSIHKRALEKLRKFYRRNGYMD